MSRRDRNTVAGALLLAGVAAAAYALISPPSIDLPAHLLRARLFSVEGFSPWSNWWYGGHDLPGYSVLFPAIASLAGPQLPAALAATGTALLLALLVVERFGARARPAALWFALAAASELLSGRLAFTFGLLPASAALVALSRRRTGLAAGLGALSALCSPVTALFVALAGAAGAVASGSRRAAAPGAALVLASLGPVAALAAVFPEGGSEPFAPSALWPLLVLCALALATCAPQHRTLRAGIALYAAACLLAFALPTPVGGNVTRLGTLVAGPLAVLPLWRGGWRRVWLAPLLVALLYLQWQGGVRSVLATAGAPSSSAAYYTPLNRFLTARGPQPFRVEIPFTAGHWESLYVAERHPLARGWERQLDRRDDALFYGGTLTAARYRAWLQALAVRYVAVPDAPPDPSARAELSLIVGGLPYLRLVQRTSHWRIFAVAGARPLAEGAAAATALGPDWVGLDARRAGWALVRVRYSPYWALAGMPGCVAPEGEFTRVRLAHPGRARLRIAFTLARLGARTIRCSGLRPAGGGPGFTARLRSRPLWTASPG